MLQKCLEDFVNSGTQPTLIRTSITPGTNFEMFLYDIEHKLIDKVVEIHSTVDELHERIKKVCNRFYELPLLEQQLYKVLKNAFDAELNGEGSEFEGGLDITGKTKEIQHYLHLYDNREYRDTPLLDNIMDIVHLLNYECPKQALMEIYYGIMIQKEDDRKPLEYYNCQHRDGIEVMNFLFDLLNDYAGYTELYYDEMKMSHEEWKAMVKPMRTNHHHEYLKDKHPHVLLVIEKAGEILNMKDQRATDWVESLAMRLYNPIRFRRHFPVILESNQVLYYNFELYDRLNLYNLCFPNLHFEGYGETSKANTLARIYNIDQANMLQNALGNSIYHTHIFTEVAIRSSKTFVEMVEDIPNMKEFTRAKRQFYYKLNKVFTNPRVADALDDGEIDFLVTHALHRFVKAHSKCYHL